MLPRLESISSEERLDTHIMFALECLKMRGDQLGSIDSELMEAEPLGQSDIRRVHIRSITSLKKGPNLKHHLPIPFPDAA